jgi:16S rRNA (cytosine967-C5)-methyltransferase
MVNAVLRKLATQLPGTKMPPAASAHPSWLVERWSSAFGVDAVRQICEYDQSIPEVAVRVSDASVREELAQAGITLAPGRILASANRVESGEITRTAAFREGRIAIQDEGSQLVALLVGHGKRMLDCCAAPGGKTRVLAEQNSDASIIALELHDHRSRLLRKLVPARNVEVTTADALEFHSDSLFDRVLVDVPCTGTGTLARNPEIKWRLKPADLLDLHARQTAILRSAMKLVDVGGRLIYSTCSLEREENLDVVSEALASDNSFRLIDCRTVLEDLRARGELLGDLDSLLSGPYLRTVPGVHPCDGFFAAILEKN